MRAISFVLLFAITLPMIGCSVPATVSPAPIESSTPTVQLTQTPSPTAIQITSTPPPTRTPEPGLRTNGPYFGYFRHVPGFSALQFVLMDADGGGRKVFDLPDEITDTSSTGARYVSPDGKWLAFYTGYAGSPYEEATQTTFDLTLNLFNLDTGETQIVTPLLSKDYPDNFVKAVDEINGSYLRPEDLHATFLAWITRALAWSPDGMHLAFAGQMDGLSSDPYLYDMTTKKIQRLSSNNEELQWIDWSPDGKWILHGSRSSTNEMADYSIYYVARDNSSIHDLGYGFAGDWLNSHEILEYRFGIERYQLRLVDLNTGKITEIWGGQFAGYEVDPTRNWILVNALSSTVPPQDDKLGFVPGIQLINLKSLERMQIQDPDSSSQPLRLFRRSRDGVVVNLPSTIEMIAASPDTKYWAVVDAQGIKIYTQDLTLVKEIPVPLRNTKTINAPWRPDDMQWSPDSSGLFLLYDKNICSVNISSGEIHLVETHFTGAYRSAGWINGK